VHGVAAAGQRQSLGKRIGCQLDTPTVDEEASLGAAERRTLRRVACSFEWETPLLAAAWVDDAPLDERIEVLAHRYELLWQSFALPPGAKVRASLPVHRHR